MSMEKRILKRLGIYILSAVLCVLIIFYIVYHLVQSFTSDVETMAAALVTVNESYNTDAYIFRDEKVLYAGDGGSVSFIYDDGVMVRRGAAVATVFTGATTDEDKAKISDIERRLNILEKSSLAKDVTVTDSTSIDSQIDSLYYTMEDKINSGDIDYVLHRKDELLTLLNKRQLLLKSVNSFSENIGKLESEKLALTSALGTGTQTVYTEDSGYIYSDVDGYEERFTLEAADNFTVEDFRTLTDSQPDVDMENAVGKIATGYMWYIACEVPSVHQQYYAEGNSYQVRFPFSADEIVPMTLARIVTSAEADSIVLVFSTGHVPEGFNFLRKQSVEIVQQTYTGYRVPVSCVRIVDGVQGVYVKEGNMAIFKEINTLVEIDGYFIVEEQNPAEDGDYQSKLGMYDLVIVKGKNLHDRKIIQ